jgi:hypothetical protein
MYGLGTYNELNTMFGLEADSGLYNNMLYGIVNPKSWVENTGDVEYFINIYGETEYIDAFKEFIHEKTGYKISTDDNGQISIDNINNRDNIGSETIAGIFSDYVTDDSYNITYEIVKDVYGVDFDAYGAGKNTARFDIGDFLSANKTAEDVVTAMLLHTLVEQKILELNPIGFTNPKGKPAYIYAHVEATEEEGLFLFGDVLTTRLFDHNRDKTVWTMSYETVTGKKEQHVLYTNKQK